MLANIFAIFGVIKELIALIKMLMKWRDDLNAAEAYQKRIEREKALEAAKVAKTDEDAFNAQEQIVKNGP